MEPVIIEAAITGPSKDPRVPKAPADIAAQAIACLEAGASIVHSHIDDQMLLGEPCAARYLEGYRPILEKHPDAILCCTVAGDAATPAEERYSHIETLAGAGMRMAICDPGSLNFNRQDAPDGTPEAGGLVYINTYADTRVYMDVMRRHRVGPSISVFEPSFLRATLAYHKAGKLPPGALVKIYFGGDYSPFVHQPSNTTFGFPPTRKALDAYLELLEGTNLPWSVAVIGGDIIETGLAHYALERGGHLRVGVEDYGGPRRPANLELVQEVAALVKRSGRDIADAKTACKMLSLPR